MRRNKLRMLLWIGPILLFPLVSWSPLQKRLTYKEIIEKYFDGLNSSDFNKTSSCLNDNFLMLYYDEVWARDKEQLYHHFKNDSIFESEYKLIDFKSDSNKVEVWIAKIDRRLEFLLETALLSRYRFTFNGKTISKITIVDDDETDFDKLTVRKDSLTSWINKNHPELSGFENDRTVEGSINYLNAIELYKNRK